MQCVMRSREGDLDIVVATSALDYTHHMEEIETLVLMQGDPQPRHLAAKQVIQMVTVGRDGEPLGLDEIRMHAGKRAGRRQRRDMERF